MWDRSVGLTVGQEGFSVGQFSQAHCGTEGLVWDSSVRLTVGQRGLVWGRSVRLTVGQRV